jgi:biotin carboxylase
MNGSKRRLLIISAGTRQVTVIRKALELGIEVVATDRNPQAAGAALATQFIRVDSRDVVELTRIARDRTVHGVISEQTDVGVLSAALVAEELGLPGIGRAAALNATDKGRMRESCRKANLCVPQYHRVSRLEEATEAAQEIGYPVVLKPIDAQASRGVRKIDGAAELPDAFQIACGFSQNGGVLVEEFLVGRESSVEAIVDREEIRLLGISEKTKSALPFRYDLRLIYPPAFSDEECSALKTLNEKVVRAVGIGLGLTHAEYVLTESGPILLEVAARGCGAGVATELLPALTQADIIGARIRQALGEPSSLSLSSAPRWGVLEFLIYPPGMVRHLSGVEEATGEADVLGVELNIVPGDVLTPVTNGDGRHGQILSVGDSREDALAAMERAKAHLIVDYEGGGA